MPKRGRETVKGSGGSEVDHDKKATNLEEEGGEESRVDSKDAKLPVKRGRTDESIEEDEEEDEEDYDDEYDSEGEPSQNFVAWLEKDSTSLSVGELHFSNVEHVGSHEPNAYCVVYQLDLLPPPDTEEDEESPLVFSFQGGFPFRVLPAAECVGIPLEPVVALAKPAAASAEEGDDDEVVCTEFTLQANIHQSLVEDILGSISDGKYTTVSPHWRIPVPACEKAVLDGLTAWWKAGEDKAGWDLSRIPKDDSATCETISGFGSSSDDNNNTLLDLYTDLCAFKPLTHDDDRDTIEERFEWRTCLCTYFAWAVPNDAAVNVLKQLGKPILEVGAGTGYWAWLLSLEGVDIVAYDAPDSHDGHKHRFRHGMVRDGGVEQAASEEHGGRALMLCWPDIVGDSAADDADRGTFGVDTLRAYSGDTVVYVGELGPGVTRAAEGWGDPFPPGGSSASAAFQEELRATYALQKRVKLPNWPPYNSHLTVWKRK